jgi:sigma-B regulation protein RsbU (phosphoserine phosphatase)
MSVTDPQTQTPQNIGDVIYDARLQRALEAIADVTQSTTALFDPQGALLAGPFAGSDFINRILSTGIGRQAIIDAHQSALDKPSSPQDSSISELLGPDKFNLEATPVIRNGRHVASITLGGRPKRPLPTDFVEHLAETLGLETAPLQEAAATLGSLTSHDATAARNMLALIAELLGTVSGQEESLRKRVEELTAVYNIMGMLVGTLDPQEILDKTARMICEAMRVKACSIRMLDESTGLLKVKAVHNLSEEYLNKGNVVLSENAIDGAAMQGTIVHIVNAPTDPRIRYPEQAAREGLASGLVCGLIYRGRAVGVIRVYTGDIHHFSPFEESLLRAVASQAAALVTNARLLRDKIEAERNNQQLVYAGEVQRRMIPHSPPACSSMDIGTVYSPTYQVGGDYYDFLCFPKGNLGMAIADVSGKGVPASLLMASLRATLRAHAYHTYDIDHIISEVNRHVCRETTPGEFATLFYGVLAPDARRLTYCNAGHDPVILLRNDAVHYLETGGMVLGVQPDSVYERGVLELQPGDIVLMYTDGAVEALNFNDERYGRDRLVRSLKKYAPLNAQLIAKNILWDIRRFRGLADRTDDLTMVALKIK